MTFPLSLHPDVNNISQRPMRERGRPACHPPLLPHALRFSAFYALFSSTTASLALSTRTSCCIIGNFTLRIWRCKGGGGKKGGNGLTSATKSFWIGAGTVFFIWTGSREWGSRIRSFGPLAAWLRPATQRQLSFLVPASLCPWIVRQQVKFKLFFFFCSKSLFVQSEHIGD